MDENFWWVSLDKENTRKSGKEDKNAADKKKLWIIEKLLQVLKWKFYQDLRLLHEKNANLEKFIAKKEPWQIFVEL